MKRKIKLLAGVGKNDADYPVTRREVIDGKNRIVWMCPFYIKWANLLKRCYSESVWKRHPSYKNCKVVDEWHLFSTFKAWMEKQDWKDKHLDKDILFPGNKLYGPETCIFVTPEVNSFITENDSARGDYPIGVCFDSGVNKFRAECKSLITGKKKYLGLFLDAQSGHKAWLAFKLEQAKILAARQTDERIAKALIERYENYENQ